MSNLTIITAENMDLFEGGFGQPVGGFYIRTFLWKAGKVHDGHSHYIDHCRSFVSGQALLKAYHPETKEKKEWLILEPAKIEIAKDWWHETIAITDCKWECWFSRREADELLEKYPNLNWTKEN